MELSNYYKATNIYSLDTHAASLIERFVSCPYARVVLDSIGDSVSIDVATGDFPHHVLAFDLKGSKEVSIQIPSKKLESNEALKILVFDIFNVKGIKNIQTLYLLAEKGDMGMDEYSRKFEVEEFKSKEEYDKLIRQCEPFFEIKPEPGIPDQETQLWNREIYCHTDMIRSRWIDDFQKNYCKKKPNDLHSCNAKKEELCDLNILNNLPEIAKKIILTRRICKLFPFASKKIQASYKQKDLANCRDFLKDGL